MSAVESFGFATSPTLALTRVFNFQIAGIIDHTENLPENKERKKEACECQEVLKEIKANHVASINLRFSDTISARIKRLKPYYCL